MYGYNSGKYDKFMIAALLMHHTNVNGTKELIKILYETSQKLFKIKMKIDLIIRMILY